MFNPNCIYVSILLFRNPNNPVDVSDLINTTWPEYGSDENFLEISPDMTSKSVQQRLAPEAFEFWPHLCPTLIEATRKDDTKPTSKESTGFIVG